MPVSQFSDERLRRAVQETKGAIEGRNQNLDRISGDIKQLERYLEEAGVREQVEVHLGGGATALGEAWELQESGEAPAEDVSEFLVWEKLATQDRWRIMYLKTRRQGWWTELVGDFVFEGDPEVIDHKPLIETPAVVRLRASEVLPDLVKSIATNTKGPKTLAKESERFFKLMLKAVSKNEKKTKRIAKNQAQ